MSVVARNVAWPPFRYSRNSEKDPLSGFTAMVTADWVRAGAFLGSAVGETGFLFSGTGGGASALDGAVGLGFDSSFEAAGGWLESSGQRCWAGPDFSGAPVGGPAWSFRFVPYRST